VNADSAERGRMIFDLPSDVQMAIKIKAVKSSMTTGEVVAEAIKEMYGVYLEEAKIALSELKRSNVKRKKS
jgi:hypothetical protein